MEDIDGEQDVVEFWLIEEFMKDIDKSFASGSLKMARDGKTLTFRPWRNLRLIPKAKARRWTGEEDVEKKMAFLRSVHSKPSRTYDIEGNPVHAIYAQYFSGYNGYIGGDVLLEMLGLPTMGADKIDIISNHTDGTGWISRKLRVFGHPPRDYVILEKKNLRYVMFLDAVERCFQHPCVHKELYRILYRGARRWHLEQGLIRKYARSFYGEDVLENVERIFTIGKTRDHTPPWAERKASAGGDHP